jgi:NADPH-dependent 2,4-dienoyl-CoA reductase/sulfur reductase-like enzyme
MNATCDIAVIGAGPAGMAAAEEASAHGLRIAVLDEQPEPGGQIYRNISTNAESGSRINDILGPDYRKGAPLARRFAMACEDGGIDYRSETTVWQIDSDLTVHLSQAGGADDLRAHHLIVATGAMERPVPIPGWTLPGVMSAGGAQIMLKAGRAVPDGSVVIAGAGPLLLLVARQLADAGAEITAVLETTGTVDYLAALPTLPAALRAQTYLRKGIAMRRSLRMAKIPIYSGVSALAAVGGDRLEAIRFMHRGKSREISAGTVLLHHGVVPNVQITRQLGCDHAWDEAQRCWRPVLDDWYNASIPGVAVAGDGGGIAGAEAAALAGRIAALEAVHTLGRISTAERDAKAAPLRRELAGHLAIRPLLDALYRPPQEILAPPGAATVVCRCEEVTAGAIRDAVALGATGPNQMKAYLRCGMGPCQGRLCGLTVSEIIAEARDTTVAETGYYRIRPPIKPVTLGELAGIDV